jgi:antitoxin component of RelBE/YafQ-DinJ toxin-antitoxin module
MKEVRMSIKDSVIESVEQVIEPLGLDIEMVIKILLNRISREKSVAFLLASSSIEEAPPLIIGNTIGDSDTVETGRRVDPVRDMRKSLAISLFRGKGITFNGNVTYASKNRASNHYWANPSFEVLEREWFLILNDWVNRVLYLFRIPAGAISQYELVPRADINHQIDLQISYNDSNFTDTRSNYMFRRFLFMSENY